MEELCKICKTEALELNLKNEEEFFKRTNRGVEGLENKAFGGTKQYGWSAKGKGISG